MSAENLVELSVDSLHASPNQPRAVIHRETIEGIKAAIADNGGAFPVEMAITVRPAGKGFEIIAGHHRVMAASEAGLSAVWGFVKCLDDREALRQLVASNNQQAMTGYEHGAAALKLKDQGVTFAEYARITGKAYPTLMNCVYAYEVLSRFGGMNGRFASVPYRIMADLRPFQDEAVIAQILFVIWNENPPQQVTVEAIKLARQGESVYRAFELARKLERKRRKARAIKSVDDPDPKPEGESNGGPDGGGGSWAWGAAVQSKEYAETSFAASLYLTAIAEEYAARFGHLIRDREEFTTAVLQRMDTLKSENQLDEPIEAERKAS